MLPAVAGILKRGAKRRRDLLRWDANVQLTCAEPAGPSPDVAVELQVKIAEEAIGQNLVEAEGAVSDCVKEVFKDLGENYLLGLVEIRLRRVIPEQRPRLCCERVGLFRIKRCLAVARRQRHQAE